MLAVSVVFTVWTCWVHIVGVGYCVCVSTWVAELRSSGVAAGCVGTGQWPAETESDYRDSDNVPSRNQILGYRGSCRGRWGLFTKVQAKCDTLMT